MNFITIDTVASGPSYGGSLPEENLINVRQQTEKLSDLLWSMSLISNYRETAVEDGMAEEMISLGKKIAELADRMDTFKRALVEVEELAFERFEEADDARHRRQHIEGRCSCSKSWPTGRKASAAADEVTAR